MREEVAEVRWDTGRRMHDVALSLVRRRATQETRRNRFQSALVHLWRDAGVDVSDTVRAVDAPEQNTRHMLAPDVVFASGARAPCDRLTSNRRHVLQAIRGFIALNDAELHLVDREGIS